MLVFSLGFVFTGSSRRHAAVPRTQEIRAKRHPFDFSISVGRVDHPTPVRFVFLQNLYNCLYEDLETKNRKLDILTPDSFSVRCADERSSE